MQTRTSTPAANANIDTAAALAPIATRPGWTPAEAPLPMPVQTLDAGQLRNKRLPTTPRGIFWRRLFLLGVATLLTGIAVALVSSVLFEGGLSVLEGVWLLLFTVLFAWVALSFTSTLAGFFLVLTRRDVNSLGIDANASLPQVHVRTALLMPTYNEDPERLLRGLQAIYESVVASGQGAQFDFFVLSDTNKKPLHVPEEEAFAKLRARLGEPANLFYRRRTDNAERKAGNISDWVKRWGAAYPQFLILDADSLMSGRTIVQLAAAMERNPGVALVQSLPVIVNGHTVFARMQQFAGRVYGPVMAYGIAWWHGAESNYWGHNAVIRTAAFAEFAGLPELRGNKPFAGHILSHDFVEAALLRRGGWALHMAPGLSGSYEEGPPSLTDMLVRDRRWCQGNIQHGGVFTAKGLHWINRMHMGLGIVHYFTSPCWAMLMLVGLAIPLQRNGWSLQFDEMSYLHYWLGNEHGVFLHVFEFTMTILLAPKLLGFIASCTYSRLRKGFGGVFRGFVSMILETLCAALMAPVTMFVQSRGLASVLAGQDSGWEAQRRDDGSMPLSSLLRSYGGLSAFGLCAGIVAYLESPELAAWMSPVIVGLVLSIPVVSLTSSRRVGALVQRLGLFRVPEEIAPPPVVARAAELRRVA